MNKFGIIKATKFDESNYHQILQGHFNDLSRAGIAYKIVNFISNPDYEIGVFDYLMTPEQYEAWINDCLYLIVPNLVIPDLISQINLVEDIIFEDQWDAVYAKTEVTTRNGESGFVKTKFITFTTCKLLQLDEGDEAIIQGLVDLYNSKQTGAALDHPILFNSLEELNIYKSNHSL